MSQSKSNVSFSIKGNNRLPVSYDSGIKLVTLCYNSFLVDAPGKPAAVTKAVIDTFKKNFVHGLDSSLHFNSNEARNMLTYPDALPGLVRSCVFALRTVKQNDPRNRTLGNHLDYIATTSSLSPNLVLDPQIRIRMQKRGLIGRLFQKLAATFSKPSDTPSLPDTYERIATWYDAYTETAGPQPDDVVAYRKKDIVPQAYLPAYK